MKFGKYIVENSVPEWRTRYINYSKLKKFIKKSRIARDMVPEGSRQSRTRQSTTSSHPVSFDDSNISIEEGDDYLQLLDIQFEEDKDFFVELVKQIRKTIKFHQEQENEAKHKLASLREQCDILVRLGSDGPQEQNSGSLANLPRIVAFQSTFGQALLRKNNAHASNIDNNFSTRNNGSASDASTDSEEDTLMKTEEIVATTANPRQKLVKVIKEYYRLLELIKNYRILNEIAIQKILKKFTKGTGMAVNSFEAKTKQISLVTSNVVNTLIVETENLYAAAFEDGIGSHAKIAAARRQAKKVLRVPDYHSTGHAHHAMSTWRSGLMTGLAIPPIILVIRKITSTPESIEFEFLLQIYGGLSVPIFFLYLFALCLQIWDHYHINWVLIFELDPREYMAAHKFFEIAALLLLLFSYTMYFAVVDSVFGLHPYFYAPIMVGFVLALLVLPVPIIQSQSRVWLWKSMFRIIFSGCFEVQFRDFFLCDLMISMTYSFIAFQGIFCIATHPFDPVGSCTSQGSLGASIITALPTTWRLLQCFRRFHDNRKTHPHLTNAVKYILSLTVIFLSTVSKYTNSKVAYGFWICASVCATIFSYCWDVFYDWGLLNTNKNHQFLRTFIIYPKWVYFNAIWLNALLRLGWVMLLAPSYWSLFTDFRSIVYVAALLEVFRRFGWAVIRLENEHSNNVGKFRAVKELPLPFRINMEVPLVHVTSR
ncbi:hypothetical protein BDV3_007324 [Batrachochytrium dendrobatidis]|nr:Xenotropic and polytropic retrovirus receptor 1 [Batrachochytrium dendrobatidis]KAK5667262.1 Xenotropic and polytropic retrovirus receptor 1 [Batrachochytrium dendrobatidis]